MGIWVSEDGQERGVAAQRSLRPGDVIVEVPLRLAITDYEAAPRSGSPAASSTSTAATSAQGPQSSLGHDAAARESDGSSDRALEALPRECPWSVRLACAPPFLS